MPEMVTDCPRCNAKKHTFIVYSFNFLYADYGWKKYFETFCVCKHCAKSTIFVVSQKTIVTENYLAQRKNYFPMSLVLMIF